MKIRTNAGFLSIALLTVAGTSAFADSASARAGISEAYQKLADSMERRQLAGVESVLAPGFKSIEGSTVENRAKSISEFKQMMAISSKIYSVSGTVGAIKLKSATSAITTDSVAIHSRMVLSGKQHDMRMKGNYRDTWVQIGGAWKLLQSTTLGRPVELIDGKPPTAQVRHK